MPDTMPALTLWQPWASLIAVGAKRIETRSWEAPERLNGRRIAIHAARKFDLAEQRLCLQVPFWKALHVHYAVPGELPTGAVVATATLAECAFFLNGDRMGRYEGPKLVTRPIPASERPFGDFTSGRYGWILTDIHRLATPIPARGAQMIWQWQPPEGFEP